MEYEAAGTGASSAAGTTTGEIDPQGAAGILHAGSIHGLHRRYIAESWNQGTCRTNRGDDTAGWRAPSNLRQIRSGGTG